MTSPAQLALALDACAAVDHDTATCARCIEAAFADGRLRLLIDEPRSRQHFASMFVGEKVARGEQLRVIHVLSRPAGGEIRGYVLTDDDVLRLRLPEYAGAWPALDAAVSSRVGARSVAPYAVDQSGSARSP